MNDKAHHFLLLVQTMFLANAINRRADDVEGKKRHMYSASRALMAMDDAIYASTRIPEDITATEAASEFAAVSFLEERKISQHDWFARH